MNRFIFLVLLTSIAIFASSQTIVFHENFDGALGGDSVTSSPANGWALTSQLFVSPNNSDSSVVVAGDTSSIITNSFVTTGNSFVLLEFDHICKIEFFDAAEIFVSTNNGASWSKLIQSYYLGSGQFGNFNNKFAATSYSMLWDATNASAIPQNSWWVHEVFDISGLVANNANVKVKFQLRDGNGTGPAGNYGWLIDNIKVTAAAGELIPPVVNLSAPLIGDSVYYTGPYGIYADITDASGIDTAILIYKHNSLPPDTIGMINTVTNTFYGLIDTFPSFNIGDTVCYRIIAKDNSPMSNSTQYPFNSCDTFFVTTSPPPPGCSTPITVFPYSEDFETGFTAGSGSASNPGTLATGWNRTPSSGYMWIVNNGSTSSSSTGPSGDHTSGSGLYLYTEASTGATGNVAELVIPCVDINQINVPYLEFYYHMFGASMGELHVDVYYGGQWQQDIMPAIIGNQADVWHKMSINLTNYKSITKIRFRALRGSSYTSDICIDDIKIWQPPAYDVGVISIDRPVSPANTGLQDVKASFKNFGSATINKITVNWTVNQIAQPTLVWTGTLMPGNVADSITLGQFNFVSGPSTIKAWTSGPNDSTDAINTNDTSLVSVIACTSPLHGTYVIGGSNPDFATIGDAVYAIVSCGIDSHIVFNISPGTYTEQISIDAIIGASDTSTVVFQSLTGDSTSVILQYSVSSSANNYVLLFHGSSFVSFKNITIKSLGTSFGRVVVYEMNASNIGVENCRIEMAGTSYSNNGFYGNSTSSNNLLILNNYVNGGYYALFLRGNTSVRGKQNVIKNNFFDGYYSYGSYIQYQDSLIYMGNRLANDTNANYVYNTYFYQISGPSEIVGNTITSYAQSTQYGIRLYYFDGAASGRALVANNIVAINGNSTSVYGIYAYNTNHVDYYYNSVAVNTSSSQYSRCMYISSGGNINLKNNIFTNMADGYAYYITQPSLILQSDYNDLYSTGQNIAYWGTQITTLSALKTASGKEQNSISILPPYVSTTNLHMSNGTMNYQGTPLANVPLDVDYEVRSTIAPSIGADELPPIPIDAGVLSILKPISLQAQGDTVAVKIVIKNFGTDTLPSFNYSYLLNGVVGPQQTYPAGLLPNMVDTVTFPDIIITPGHNNICAFTILAADLNTFNDTNCKYYYATPKIDMGVTEIVNPDSGMCYTATEMFIVKIKNFGSETLDMSVNPVTIHTSITGAILVIVPDKVVSSGTLTSGQEINVTIINNLNIATTAIYNIDVWTSVAGDGDVTTDSVDTKIIDVYTTVTALPFVQDFENFTPSATSSDPGTIGEGWTIKNTSENIAWYVGTGSTYTSNTGPLTDHTTASANGKYLYTESTGYSAGYTLLTSPCIDLSSFNHPTLKFWYHTYGADINSIRIDVLSNGNWHYSAGYVIGHHQNASIDSWKQQIVDLSAFSGTIRFRFRASKSNGLKADMAIDDILIFDPLPHDAGISAQFVSPTNNFTTTGNSVPVEVKIENLGLDTLTNLLVGYIAGNAQPVLESWTGSIVPNGSETYVFNTPLIAPVGEVDICAFTNLLNDNDRSNDTACFSFTGVPLLSLPYVDDFEGTGYFVSSGGNQQWENGSPTKTIFNAAHSPSNAWVTSLNDNYLNNSEDYLYTPFFDFTTLPNCTLSFQHRLDAQPSHDGGQVQYTTDGGVTWLTLGYMGDPLATHWYNSNLGGSHSWSSVDSNWRHSTYDMSAFNTFSSLQFRFKFYSDGTNNSYEGWMIDDLKIFPGAIAQDAGVVEIISPVAYTTPSSSATVKIRIKNHGTQLLTSVPVSYQIDGNAAVTALWTGSMAPGASADYTFAVPYTATDFYRLKVATNLTGDTYLFNDTASIYINKDVAINSVLLPRSFEVIGDTVQIAISVQNNGIDTITTLDFEYTVNSASASQETWTGILPPNTTMIYYFTKYYTVLSGIKNVCATVTMTGDTKAANNKQCKYVNGTVAIAKVDKNTFEVLQNQPNPFNEFTIISYIIPTAAKVQLRLMDLSGRIIMQKEAKASIGKNQFQINAAKLEAGVYFYEISYKDESVRRKMVVVR